MKSAYNETWLHNLAVAKEAKQWRKDGFLSQEQLAAVYEEYKSGFYHPNLIIRILLFIASLVALSGITGLFGLMLSEVLEDAYAALSLIYGIVSFVILEIVLIRNNNHYKSGVSEALLYHSIGFTILGIGGASDFNAHVMIISCLLIFSFTAYRYLDLISTAAALCSLAALIFYEVYEMEGMAQQVIPIVFIILFTPFYFYVKNLKKKENTDLWENCLILAEAFSLLMIYLAGNYFVVRELSVNLMSLSLEDGENIPFALLFYFLTVSIPFLYLYFGIKNKDLVLLRVSLLVLAFSVFTFKFYYSTGHHEITFTVSGLLLLSISLALFRYLKTPKHGYTRDNIVEEKWAETNPEAFIISQTLGGNAVTVDNSFKGGGGSFGGGGASGDF
jgi:uncharacterized membrane protein YgcG